MKAADPPAASELIDAPLADERAIAGTKSVKKRRARCGRLGRDGRQHRHLLALVQRPAAGDEDDRLVAADARRAPPANWRSADRLGERVHLRAAPGRFGLHLDVAQCRSRRRTPAPPSCCRCRAPPSSPPPAGRRRGWRAVFRRRPPPPPPPSVRRPPAAAGAPARAGRTGARGRSARLSRRPDARDRAAAFALADRRAAPSGCGWRCRAPRSGCRTPNRSSAMPMPLTRCSPSRTRSCAHVKPTFGPTGISISAERSANVSRREEARRGAWRPAARCRGRACSDRR